MPPNDIQIDFFVPKELFTRAIKLQEYMSYKNIRDLCTEALRQFVIRHEYYNSKGIYFKPNKQNGT